MSFVRPVVFVLMAILVIALPSDLPASRLLDDPGMAPSAEPIRFMRDPHVAGNLMAFSYQGDIWLSTRDGSNPRRLTNHVARDVAPRFSPDGNWMAFSSNRFGNYDVWLMPVEGGEMMWGSSSRRFPPSVGPLLMEIPCQASTEPRGRSCSVSSSLWLPVAQLTTVLAPKPFRPRPVRRRWLTQRPRAP